VRGALPAARGHAIRSSTAACAGATASPSRPPPAKPAIVLDIDETSLSNYAGLAATGFSSLGTALPPRSARERRSPRRSTCNKDARAHGVAVFFITGRPSAIRSPTESNLRGVGYDQGWDGLDFKPSSVGTLTFKSERGRSSSSRATTSSSTWATRNPTRRRPRRPRVQAANPFYFIGD